MRTSLQLLTALAGLLPAAVAGAVPLEPRLEEPSVDALLEMEAPASGSPLLKEALRLLNRGSYAEAIVEARGALEQQPDSAPAYEILGAALAKQGELEQAQAALERSVELAPSGISGLRKLGNVQLARGEREAARSSFELVLERDPLDRIAHQRLGILAQSERRYADAIRHYEQGLVGTAPAYVGVKIDLARLYNAAGRFDDTVLLLRPLRDKAESNAALASLLGTAYLEKGHVSVSLRYLRLLVKLRPEEAAAAYLLSTALRLVPDPDAALAEARRVVALEPEWPPGYMLLGEILLDAGRPREALAPLQKSVSLSSNPALPALALARAHRQLGDRARARAVLEKLVAGDTLHTDVYLALGRLQQEEGDIEGARASFASALERAPADPDVLVAAGAFHGFAQEYERALPLLERALEERPGDSQALRALAWASARSGRGERAEQAARLLMAKERNVDNLLLLAKVLRETGSSPEAAQLYEEILADEPEQVLALANLSLIRAEQERWEDARSLAQRAVGLVPADSPLHQTLDPILAGQPPPPR